VTVRNPDAAQAGGYVLALAGVLVAVGLLFHPVPSVDSKNAPPSLPNTVVGADSFAIAAGFVLCVLGSLLILVPGETSRTLWPAP